MNRPEPDMTIRRDALENPKLNHLDVAIRALKQKKVVAVTGLGTVWDDDNPKQYNLLLTTAAATNAGLTLSRVMTVNGPANLKPKQAEGWTTLIRHVKCLTRELRSNVGLFVVVPKVPPTLGLPADGDTPATEAHPGSPETTQQVFTVTM
jgi:hypothetical protein